AARAKLRAGNWARWRRAAKLSANAVVAGGASGGYGRFAEVPQDEGAAAAARVGIVGHPAEKQKRALLLLAQAGQNENQPPGGHPPHGPGGAPAERPLEYERPAFLQEPHGAMDLGLGQPRAPRELRKTGVHRGTDGKATAKMLQQGVDLRRVGLD